jgi:hypothetical protein
VGKRWARGTLSSRLSTRSALFADIHAGVHTESGHEPRPGSPARGMMSREGHLSSDGPHERRELACDRHHHDVGMLPLGHEPTVALAKAHLGFPGDVADRLGEGFLTLLHRTAHLGVVAIGPSPLDEDTAGVGIAGLGDPPEPAGVAGRILGRGESQITHELSWAIKTTETPELRDGAEGDGELDPAQGVEGFDHGMESPALGLFLQLGLDALHSLVVFVDRPHVLL